VTDYKTWRDFVISYVRTRADAAGWVVRQVHRSRVSRSLYIHLRREGVRAVIRVSDHKPKVSEDFRHSMFSIRHGASTRLGELDAWLQRRFQIVRDGWTTNRTCGQ